MIKITLLILILLTTSFASSYNFVETRYSDALAKSMHLKGVITFDDGLKIEYANSNRVLIYEDGELDLLDDGGSVDLDEGEALKIAQYFEIILMLYKGDEKRIQEEFIVTKLDSKSMLIPKGELKEYMFKIELKREYKKLKEIKMFLSNYDIITISILDEIR